MRKIVSFILIFVLACANVQAGQGKYVGGDISMLPRIEANISYYKNANGGKINDLIVWLHQSCGWNTFRVRIFVDPQQKFSDYKTIDLAVLQDLDYVKALGKRIKDEGCYFMLDFHYSDSWVDATHIQSPAAWKGKTAAEKADSVGAYTRRVLDALNAYGATPDFVQVGNEIMYGMCDIKVHPYNDASDDWTGFSNLLKAGCEAVREKCPDAQIILHTDRPTNTGYNSFWYNKCIQMGVDFDVIGLSYYPFWHGTLASLGTALNSLAATFPTKKVQIVESAYYYNYWPSSGINYDTRSTWPCSVAGQYQFVSDIVDFLNDYPKVEGYSYWYPEDAGDGDYVTNWSTTSPDPRRIEIGWSNRGLWDEGKSTSGHAINKKSATEYAQLKMKDFLDPSITAVEEQTTTRAIRKIVNGRLVITRGNQNFDALGNRL